MLVLECPPGVSMHCVHTALQPKPSEAVHVVRSCGRCDQISRSCVMLAALRRPATLATRPLHTVHHRLHRRSLARRPNMAAAAVAEVPSGMSAEAALLEAFTSIPQLGKATCRPYGEQGIQLQVTATQHNLPANAKRSLQFTAFVPARDQLSSAVCSPLPTELQSSALTSVSPSGQRVLIAKPGSEGVLLEVWGGGRLLKELQVPKALHGPVVADNVFSRGASWNAAEDRLVYVAEAPVAEKTPQWGPPEEAPKDAAAPRGWRGVAAAKEDWGELNTGKLPPSIFVLDLNTWQVHQVLGLPEDQCCGQPMWDPSGQGIVFVAWPSSPLNFPSSVRRLGVVFCFNRPSLLYYVPYLPVVPGVKGSSPGDGTSKAEAPPGEPQAVPQAVKLCGELLSALQPVFTPDGSALVFLSQQAAVSSGVHHATSSLHTIDWTKWCSSSTAARAALEASVQQLQDSCRSSKQPAPATKQAVAAAVQSWNAWAGAQERAGSTVIHTVVDVVKRPSQPGVFPGLYATAVVDAPWAGPKQLLLTSQWYSQTAVVCVDLDTGAVNPVTPTGAAAGSWVLQGVANGVAACINSTPRSAPQVMLAAIPTGAASSRAGIWDWQRLAALDVTTQLPPSAAAGLAGVEWAVLDVTPTCGDATITMQAIVQAPKARPGPCPVVLVPHGGPHTAIPLNYYLPFAFLTSLGYCVVGVNYRGSTGFGEDSVQSLPGKIGTNDVADCMAALQAAVDAGWADPKRAAVVGGSHGGFLTGHLVGQYPAAFRCGGLRNPVLNIALMVGLTDIPDWCYVEAFGTEEGRTRFKPTPSAEDLAHFMSVSPIAHIHKVTVPLAFMLGSKDRRVPDDDGRRYIDALKARGVPTRVLVFPEDTHALDKPQTEYEQWLNIAWWLKQHMQD